MDKELEIIWRDKISSENFAKVIDSLKELAEEKPARIQRRNYRLNLSRLVPALCLSAVLIFIFSGEIKDTAPIFFEVSTASNELADNSIEELVMLFDDSELFDDLENTNLNLMELL